MTAPTIRAGRAADRGAILDVHRAAFDSPAECELVAELLADPPDPMVSLVAEFDGAVIGHVLFTPVRVRETWTAMALAPVGVLPHLQRRGIGSSLIERGLAAGDSLGHATVFVLGDPAYYPRFGFHPACTAGYSCRWIKPGDAHADAFMVRGDGAARPSGTVRYHAAFNRF